MLPGKINTKNHAWLPLSLHLSDTAGVMAKLLDNCISDNIKKIINPDGCRNLCLFAAYVHDIGKETAAMASKMLQDKDTDILRANLADVGIKIPQEADYSETPHSLAGEAILLKNQVPSSIASVIGSHHGKTQKKRAAKYQIEKYPKSYYGTYSTEKQADIFRQMWSDTVNTALAISGYKSVSDLPDINTAQAMLLSGLIIYADWIASNTAYFPLIPYKDNGNGINKQERIEEGWAKAKLPGKYIPAPYISAYDHFYSEFSFKPNAMQKAVISIMGNAQNPGISILEAPPGTGKTEIALILAEMFSAKNGCGGIFFGLPTVATTNGMFRRFAAWGEKQSKETVHAIKLAHGMAELNEDYEELFEETAGKDEYIEEGLETHEFFSGRKQSLLAEFCIGTIDQMLMCASKQSHVMLRQLGIAGKVVILDEVHAYDAYMDQYLKEALRWLGRYNTPVILLSATLTKAKRQELIEAYTGEKTELSDGYPLLTWTDDKKVYQKQLPYDAEDKTIKVIKKDESDIASYIEEKSKDGGCFGIILDTVEHAQAMAERLEEELPDKEIVLAHGHFTDMDRADIEKTVLKKAGKDSTDEERENLVIIGTQVLEQSLDIDFDFLITELCPMDLILQRIGRLWRHIRERYSESPEVVVLKTEDSGSIAVYGEWLLERTKSLLPEEITIPSDIGPLVQKTYEKPKNLNRKEQKDYEDYCLKLKDLEMRAKAFKIPDPGNGDMDGIFSCILESKETEIMERASVRNIKPTVEVLLMVRHENGDVGFLPWIENGRSVDISQPPDDETARIIARQNINLPHSVCPEYKIEQTMDDLPQISAWQKNKFLSKKYFLLLDDDLTAELNGYKLKYSKKCGLKYNKVKEEEK